MTARLYRAFYEHRDGTPSRVTFASVPHDALRRAADYVRCYIGGYLLALEEGRELANARPVAHPKPQLKLI